MNTYNDGDIVECTCQFVTDQLQPGDPTTITFKYNINGGAITTLTYAGATVPAVGTVARLGVGEYQTWINTSANDGTYIYEYLGTGLQTSASNTFVVIARPI